MTISTARRVWLITGTSSGFGRRLVSIALARGDRVIATAKTQTSTTKFLHDDEQDRAPNLYCAQLDISVGTQKVRERIDAIIRDSGWISVDVLVNNAGIAFTGLMEECGTDLMRHEYQTNVFGTLDVTMAVLPYMRKQRSGTVVMIGSRSGWKTDIKGVGLYGSSKAAMHAFAETLAVELEPFGIRTLIVEPGTFSTEKIYRNGFHESNPIPDYDHVRESAAKIFKSRPHRKSGDPAKAMKALVEVVCGEGRAQGKPWPLYLVLGKDAEVDVRNKCSQVMRYLDEWSEVIRDVEVDDLN